MAVGFVEVAVSEATEAPSSDSTEPKYAAAAVVVAGAFSGETVTAAAAAAQNDSVATTVALPAFGIRSAATQLVGIASVALEISVSESPEISASESTAVQCVAEMAAPEITMLRETSFC